MMSCSLATIGQKLRHSLSQWRRSDKLAKRLCIRSALVTVLGQMNLLSHRVLFMSIVLWCSLRKTAAKRSRWDEDDDEVWSLWYLWVYLTICFSIPCISSNLVRSLLRLLRKLSISWPYANYLHISSSECIGYLLRYLLVDIPRVEYHLSNIAQM